MRESTERALRWFLRRKLNQEKFALGETIHCSLKASEAELALAQAMLQEVKDRLADMDEEEKLDKN